MTQREVVLSCQGLSRWYGEVQGLSGLQLEIGSGVVGLLGPNGSGKTTFMRLITGLIRPSRGKVELFGQSVGPHNAALFQRVGYSPGDDTHFEGERARDFLRLLATLGGAQGKQATQLADQALDRVGMLEKAEVRLNAMSKGMRQRVKVAQALLFEPDLLLLDEPLNGMDPVSRRQTLDLVREWGASGRTVILASHVLHEVEDVTNRLILLHHGRLLAEGRLSEIRALVDRKPRRVVVRSEAAPQLAAEVLSQSLVSGLSFGEDGSLTLETRRLSELLSKLGQLGAAGQIDSMDLEDENLEAIFDLLVGEYA